MQPEIKISPYKNLQEAFTKAYIGLAEQGFKRSRAIFENSTFNSAGQLFCAYRAKDDDSGKEMKCAIGHLVPDELINDWVSGRSIGTILRRLDYAPERNASWIELFGNCSINDLSELQMVHDLAETPEDMKARLVNFAARCELTIPDCPLTIPDEVGV